MSAINNMISISVFLRINKQKHFNRIKYAIMSYVDIAIRTCVLTSVEVLLEKLLHLPT